MQLGRKSPVRRQRRGSRAEKDRGGEPYGRLRGQEGGEGFYVMWEKAETTVE